MIAGLEFYYFGPVSGVAVVAMLVYN